MRNLLIRHLIRIDGIAGLAAGAMTLLLANVMANLYGLPLTVLVVNCTANLLYGTYSSTLASLRSKPIQCVRLLSIANCLWAVLCFAYLLAMPSTATVFAISHAVFEGCFVGTLGVLEWQFQRQLATAPVHQQTKRASLTS